MTARQSGETPTMPRASCVAQPESCTYTHARFDDGFRLTIERLEVSMRWEKPTYKDLRFGFEVTMYIYNR
jgi:pyrroloquinoline quinone biosynthesis protein A